MEERQTNYTIMEGYELPSKGLIYDKKVNSHVELRSMTARDEMKRLAPSTTPFKTLADIIEGCMIEKPAIHVYDMALGDYEYLLHKLRVVTYGDEYKIIVSCPYCGEDVEEIIHLDDLAVKEFDLDTFESLRTITLPKSNQTVTLKFQTPRMLDEIKNKANELKRKYKTTSDQNLFVLLTSVIDSVDGTKLDSVGVENFVNNLPALDMTKILNSIDELNKCVGIDTNMVLNCSICDNEVHVSFRFGPEFFRPTTI